MYINIHFHLYFELHDHREYKIFTGIPPPAQRTVSSDSSDSFAAALIQKKKEPFLRRWDGHRKTKIEDWGRLPFFCRSRNVKRKKKPPESFGSKKRSGAFHLLQNAGEKRLTRCSARDKYTTKKCASKFALIQRTKTTIKCSHADRTVFCLLLHRKTCVWFRAGESQMKFRLGQKPSVYSSTTIIRYEWRESNQKGGNYSSKSWFLLDVCSRSGWTA